MWFDARAKLAEITGQDVATPATLATQALPAPPMSQLSQVSQAPPPKSEPQAPARPDRLDPDAGAYLDWLRLHGPATYGAAASAMGWGATRAWQAETRLQKLGLVIHHNGKTQAQPPP